MRDRPPHRVPARQPARPAGRVGPGPVLSRALGSGTPRAGSIPPSMLPCAPPACAGSRPDSAKALRAEIEAADVLYNGLLDVLLADVQRRYRREPRKPLRDAT